MRSRNILKKYSIRGDFVFLFFVLFFVFRERDTHSIFRALLIIIAEKQIKYSDFNHIPFEEKLTHSVIGALKHSEIFTQSILTNHHGALMITYNVPYHRLRVYTFCSPML